MTLERNIEAYLKRRAKECGGEVRKVKWIGRHGAPDRLLLMPWGFCFVELKAPGKELEDHQAREHGRLRKSRVPVCTVDSADAIDLLVRGAIA